MTRRECSIFKEMTKDFDQEKRKNLQRFINGTLREISALIPEKDRKYNANLEGEEAEIITEILKSRRNDIDKQIAQLELLLVE